MQGATTEELREAALAALAERHARLFECAPEGLHAWVESGAILLVARARAAREALPGHTLLASLAELQHAVVADVYLQTGELLRPGGRSASSERGLLVFAFERIGAGTLTAAVLPKRRASLTEPS